MITLCLRMQQMVFKRQNKIITFIGMHGTIQIALISLVFRGYF